MDPNYTSVLFAFFPFVCMLTNFGKVLEFGVAEQKILVNLSTQRVLYPMFFLAHRKSFPKKNPHPRHGSPEHTARLEGIWRWSPWPQSPGQWQVTWDASPFLGLDHDPGPVEVIVISHNREPGSQKKRRVPVICMIVSKYDTIHGRTVQQIFFINMSCHVFGNV